MMKKNKNKTPKLPSEPKLKQEKRKFFPSSPNMLGGSKSPRGSSSKKVRLPLGLTQRKK